jgi:energy-coupling factor transporter ATP-binding protein EcfA2
MDFYTIKEKAGKQGVIEIYPDFKVGRSTDLMVRGKGFYAVWDPDIEMWNTDEYRVQTLVDSALLEYAKERKKKVERPIHVKKMGDFSTNSWAQFRRYMTNISDNAVQLDNRLTFVDEKVKKKDYVSKRLPYSVKAGACDAYDELVSTLYDPEELEKLEWAIGSVIAGDSKDIQKFIVLYGPAGGGKSTVLNIIQMLFEGYYATFDSKALTSKQNAFATESFRDNPLVAIQHDGDLSRIDDNSKLNSIVSHEVMTMNEKYKPAYSARLNCFLFMASNKPVRITDAKSGLIRRLIDVTTSGRLVSPRKYQILMSQIEFELGAIAHRCLQEYRRMGRDYYIDYRPMRMIFQTDTFFNFVEAHMLTFEKEGGITLTRAYALYKQYCEDSELTYKLPRHKFREEFKNYWEEFLPVTRTEEGKQVRSYFRGFLCDKFESKKVDRPVEKPLALVLDKDVSILDETCGDYSAQYATRSGIPKNKWSDVDTKLSDLDTTRLHYIKPPLNHIVIDFDIKDDTGNKSAELNLEAASRWPRTYAEYSRGGAGVHLHYIYTGDPKELAPLYDKGIEVKVFVGRAALRRKFSKCNGLPISEITGGLPLKEKKTMIDFESVQSERGLRRLIERNLKKEIHPATKPSVDFIAKILDDAYKAGLSYDVTDMRPAVMAFANNSTNHGKECMRMVGNMKFRSDLPSDNREIRYSDDRPVFYDVEVFPNLLLVCWKFDGDDEPVVVMTNPEPQAIEDILKLKLVGFNCRRYDNHILYARYMGYTVEEIYDLSKRIINGSRNAFFMEAYGISYADIYDFSSKKQSLKKFEIELGLHHHELGLPWDEPVDEKLWPDVVSYCKDDVIATEKTFYARRQDFIAREILAELSGLTVNHTTRSHVARIIFGKDREPQSKFVYTDLSEMFPGYTFDAGVSHYKGFEPGEGGYVYSEPGIYENVALLDIASMHPTSIKNLNLFGPYTQNFVQLMDARMAIKHNNLDAARGMLSGALEKYLTSEADTADLSYALKIVINSVYGLTSARFDNPFKDPRNKDNIVAKRGALFMIDLMLAVQARGYTVAHVKTDSIKIPNADQEIIDFVFAMGKEYGYIFEHEATYEKMALVNDAVYIARYSDGSWTATGAQFAHPYVFKKLFSKENLVFEDYCETKSVTTALYLDFNENLPDDEHDYRFVGRVGLFCPVRSGHGGGLLLRKKNDKYYSVTGTKGYRWKEADIVRKLNKEDVIDTSYHETLVDKAIANIAKYGSFEQFVK